MTTRIVAVKVASRLVELMPDGSERVIYSWEISFKELAAALLAAVETLKG